MPYPRLIQYFRACFESDNREQSIWNLLAKDTEHLYWLPEKDKFDLPKAYAEPAYKSIEAYRREKNYQLGAYCCTGKIHTEFFQKSRSRQICAPLLLFDVDLRLEAGQWRLVVDESSVRWNSGPLAEIAKDMDLIKQLDALQFTQPFATQSRTELTDLFQSINGDLDVSTMGNHELASAAEIQSAFKSQGLRVLPGCAVFLSKRSLQTRGILHELDQLQEAETFSPPLYSLMQSTAPLNRVSRPNFDKIPGLLSQAQRRALSAAANHSMSLLIGPPGTGKSYTIAAMALDRFIQGESVLIVGNNEHALDVVMDKLVEVFSISSEAIIRAGDHNYVQQLKAFIDHITLHGVEWQKQFAGAGDLRSTERSIKKLEKQFYAQCRQALFDGRFIKSHHLNNKKGFFGKLRWYFLRNRLHKSNLLSQMFAQLQQQQQRHEVLLADFINHMQKGRLHRLIKRKRQQLVSFSKAIKARTAKSQERYFSRFDYDTLLHVFPIWLVSLSKLHKVLPLKAGMFDVVIFDEATQCDLTTSLPAMYRAKRAVVVGDTKQLRFVSFLSKDAQGLLQEKYQLAGDEMELNYRDNSLVDYAHMAIQNQEAVNILDEHYRSLPPLIGFNNRTFYENQLKLMTAKPDINPSVTLFAVHCNGRRQRNVNKQEAEVLMMRLQQIMDTQKDLPRGEKQSIGVLSFFRDQAEYLEKQILKHVDLASIKQHKLRASTPYGFQGEERDIMLISCALDDEASPGSYIYLNRQDMFNVATSRARQQQILFLSASLDNMPPNNLLTQYLQYMDAWVGDDIAQPQRRELQNQVAEFFQQQGWRTHVNFSVAGMDMDIMVSHQGQAVAVDLLGFPDTGEQNLSLQRYQLLERANLKVFPLSYGMWLLRREEIVEQMQNLLGAGMYNDSLGEAMPLDHHLLTAIAHIRQRLVELSLGEELALLNELLETFQTYVNVLSEKLSPSELTYVRYRQVAEQVVRAAMDNMEQLVYLHMGLNSIQGSMEEKTAARQKAEEFLQQNRLAMQQLKKAVLQLSQLSTGTGHSDLEMDQALAELQRRVDDIQEYNS